MALSDSCFEFLQTMGEAAGKLAKDVHRHSDPDNPIAYGAELDALRRACTAVAEAPYDPEAGSRLIRLAASVMRYHDTPPGTAEASQREGELKKLVRLLEEAVDADDAAGLPAMVENVATESQFTTSASRRLKRLMPKLGKSAYEVAIKIISDVGSATAKKILGL